MKVLFVHAHFDDFEFTAAGTFQLWRRKLGSVFHGRVLVCTDGKAGHHFRTREETGRLRLAEQTASAKLGGYEFGVLHLPSGETVREGCPQLTLEFLAALWKEIRDFAPDYLFCPPMPADPLVGLHNDHWTVAEAVRRVAYLINVPHAFTPEYPTDEAISIAVKIPVILTVYDGYMHGADSIDLVVDVSEVWPEIVAMTWCHRTQVCEWLPWVGRHGLPPPESPEALADSLRLRQEHRNRRLRLSVETPTEVFRVTAWGEVPAFDRLLVDFPSTMIGSHDLAPLRDRLALWRQSL